MDKGSLRIFFSILTSFLGVAVSGSSQSYEAEYWQQEVNYVIDVTLESDLRTITGSIDIQYINNSPDTLLELYLKAFPNAIQRDSYADPFQGWRDRQEVRWPPAEGRSQVGPR